MNEAFLKDGVDYEGTGELQTTSTRFDEALAQAAAALEFDSCVPEDFIRLVFMVRLEEGLPDGNCSPLDPYLWASDEGGKAVFFTGGIHVETPRCDAGYR